MDWFNLIKTYCYITIKLKDKLCIGSGGKSDKKINKKNALFKHKFSRSQPQVMHSKTFIFKYTQEKGD